MADESVSQNAAISLQQIVDEERAKRIKAEDFAKALVEEFTACNDFEEVRTKFKNTLKEVAPQALINIVNLMNTAESESVRANLNKWVIEWAMSDRVDGTNNELNALLSAIKKQPLPDIAE